MQIRKKMGDCKEEIKSENKLWMVVFLCVGKKNNKNIKEQKKVEEWNQGKSKKRTQLIKRGNFKTIRSIHSMNVQRHLVEASYLYLCTCAMCMYVCTAYFTWCKLSFVSLFSTTTTTRFVALHFDQKYDVALSHWFNNEIYKRKEEKAFESGGGGGGGE